MHTQADILNLVREKLGDVSDYRVAKELKVSTSVVSGWRGGRFRIDRDHCEQIAEILDWPTEYIWTVAEAEQTREPRVNHFLQRAAAREWPELIGRFAKRVPSIVLAVATLFGASHSPATSATSANIAERVSIGRVIHYACCALRRRWLMAAHLRHWFATWFPVLDSESVLTLA